MVDISGKTRLIAHLGLPTEPFKAPLIYNPWFEHAGVDAAVVPMGSRPEDYPDFLRLVFRLTNILGALVTMPHKRTTADLVDRRSPAVEIAGACNAVRLGPDGALEGDLFDGAGFVAAMRAEGHAIAGRRALIVGCGGVGSAIAAALAAEGVAALALYDVAASAAGALADRLKRHYPATDAVSAPPDPSGFDIVVNASPLGLDAADPPPVDLARIPPGAFVGEVVMAETPLLQAARARGCPAQPGLAMNYAQIPAYLAFFGLPVATPETLRKLARV